MKGDCGVESHTSPMNAAVPPPRVCALVVLLTWLTPRDGRAENSAAYKYQDYHESGGRVTVKTHGALLEQLLGTNDRVKFEGLIDSIAGATPTGQPAPEGSDQVPLSHLEERRKAWNAEYAHQFQGVNVALGAANSRESDYVSSGWSVNTVFDFNQKNTELIVGVAGTDDRIKVFHTANAPDQAKRTNDVIAGVRQLLDPHTSVFANVSWGRQRGYLSDPYKLVQKNVEVLPGVPLPLTFPENRPGEREKWILLFGLNRAFPRANGALEATYRLYRDTFDVEAHTLDVAWFQRFGSRLIVRPGFRFYDQSAAEFYHYDLDRTGIVPVAGPPRPQGPFYSSDHRLSALRTYTYGVKLIVQIIDQLRFDLALEHYEMRGRDGVTPRSAYSDARLVTAGLTLTW